MMKKISFTITIVFSILFLFESQLSGQVNYQSCSPIGIAASAIGSSTKTNGNYAFAAGNGSEANGISSIALGYLSKTNGFRAISLGEECYSNAQSYSFGQGAKANAQQSVAIGRFVQTDLTLGMGSIVIGSTNSSTTPLINNVANSLMIGFNSNKSTLFVSPSSTLNGYGRVGIATTNPQATFHVQGDSYFSTDMTVGSLSSKGLQVVGATATGKLVLLDNIQVPGDNMGDHIARQNILLGEYALAYDRAGIAALNITKTNDVFIQQDVKISRNALLNSIIGTSSNIKILGSEAVDAPSIEVNSGTADLNRSINFAIAGNTADFKFITDSKQRFRINTSLVEVGTLNNSLDLKINGNVYAESIKGSDLPDAASLLLSRGGTDGSKAIFTTYGTSSYTRFMRDAVQLFGIFDDRIIVGMPYHHMDLNVNGMVNAKEIKVSQGTWADFVFNKNYSLPSLNEVESFIIKNEHLMGIPSANEVATNGVNVGEMDALLLQKIEELYLYVIELKKENERQSAEIIKLQK